MQTNEPTRRRRTTLEDFMRSPEPGFFPIATSWRKARRGEKPWHRKEPIGAMIERLSVAAA